MINVLKKHSDIDLFRILGIDGILHLESAEKEIGNMFMLGLNPFWRYKNDIFFKEEYNDTIYRIQDTQLIPDRVFDLGKYHWPYGDRYMKNKDKNIHISQVIESETILLFRFTTGLHSEDRKDYNGIYDKATGEVKINIIEKGIKYNIYNFLNFQPVAASPNG
ncbi:MAG: 6-bladed beta-propeller, partial [Tannerellaceae bacterium]|nr:6-bladed beta-propeller [Tannerellaceae bacterium]